MQVLPYHCRTSSMLRLFPPCCCCCMQRFSSLGQAGVSVRLGREQNFQNPAKCPTRQHPRLRQTACCGLVRFFHSFYRFSYTLPTVKVQQNTNVLILYLVVKMTDRFFLKLPTLCQPRISLTCQVTRNFNSFFRRRRSILYSLFLHSIAVKLVLYLFVLFLFCFKSSAIRIIIATKINNKASPLFIK